MDKQEYIGHISPILPTNFVIPERYQEFIEYENTMLKWLEKQVEQRVATQIFKDLEEYFGLHETDCNGKDVLVKLAVREDIVMNYDNKSMNQLNIYQAIKEKHEVLDA